jgi:lactate dehydrogenase-like 2-hydroxyacid dehydrogenase
MHGNKMVLKEIFKKSIAFLAKRSLKNDKAITVFGLGKVGTAIAAVALENKFKVYGFDVNEQVTKSLANQEYRTQEPHVDVILKKFSKNFQIEAKLQDAIKASSISVIIVPTPSMEDGNFSSQAVEIAVKRIIDSINLDSESSKNNLKLLHAISLQYTYPAVLILPLESIVVDIGPTISESHCK